MNTTHERTDAEMTEADFVIGGLNADEFTAYEIKVAGMEDDALAYTLKDLQAVIKVQEADASDGVFHAKLGKYWDQFWTCADERRRRSEAAAMNRADARNA